MSDYSVAQYYAAVSAAIRAEDVNAVPGLLTLMALDGYGHEAETLRRDMAAALALRSDLLTGDEITAFAISGDHDTRNDNDGPGRASV